jgi:hypothetical protein
MDGEHRSPFFALLLNLLIPGAIFWHLGHRMIGGSLIAATLLLFPLIDDHAAEEGLAWTIHFFLGVTTGLFALAIIARRDLRR